MPALADLLDPRTAEKLAAVRAEAAEREAAAAAVPVQAPTCPECGQRKPVAAAVFRSAP